MRIPDDAPKMSGELCSTSDAVAPERRRFLLVGGATALTAWSAPAVIGVTRASAAASGPPDPEEPPEVLGNPPVANQPPKTVNDPGDGGVGGSGGGRVSNPGGSGVLGRQTTRAGSSGQLAATGSEIVGLTATGGALLGSGAALRGAARHLSARVGEASSSVADGAENAT